MQIKNKIKLSISQLFFTLERTLSIVPDLINSPYLDQDSKQNIEKINQSGIEILMYIKRFAKVEAMTLINKNIKKIKQNSKKRILSLISERATIIMATIASAHMRSMQMQMKSESENAEK